MTSLEFWSEANGPRHLFKYRAVNDWTAPIIKSRELYFSSASEFNDPFDFLPRFTMKASDRETRRYLESTTNASSRAQRRQIAARLMADPKFGENKQEAMAVADRALSEIRDGTGILSLSQRNDHLLLWGHYADSHRGIALRFKPAKGDQFFETACKVTYSKERPLLNLVTHTTEERHRLALLTKADVWQYEEEWRIVNRAGLKGSRRYPVGALDGIVLGAAIKADKESEVRRLVSDAGIDVEWQRVVIDPDDFKLNIIPA